MPSPSWYKVSALACASEFFGMIWFAFFGGIVQGAFAAIANGICLAVIIYCIVAQSGGHLNPGKSHAYISNWRMAQLASALGS